MEHVNHDIRHCRRIYSHWHGYTTFLDSKYFSQTTGNEIKSSAIVVEYLPVRFSRSHLILTELQLPLQMVFNTKSKRLHLIFGRIIFTWESHATNQSGHGIILYIVSRLNYNMNCTLRNSFSPANRGHGVRLYREEAARLDINKSILLQDNNFAVILTVHHNLHCLV